MSDVKRCNICKKIYDRRPPDTNGVLMVYNFKSPGYKVKTETRRMDICDECLDRFFEPELIAANADVVDR